MFSIVFAVLLALALDSWQENVKKEQVIQKALDDIAMEILSFMRLDLIANHNQVTLDTLRIQIQRHQNGEKTGFSTSFGRPEIKSISWTTARENGIAAGFDRQLFLDIAEVYVEFDRLIDILDYHYEFNLKSDPDMTPYTRARHIARHLESSIFRMGELNKKSIALLGKYKDHKFTQVLNRQE